MPRLATFAELQDQVFALYQAERYLDALELIDRQRDLGAGRPATVTFWRACLLSLLDRGDEAIAVLASGLDHGRWWSPVSLMWDADLEAIRTRAEFLAVVNRADRLMRQTGRAPESVLRILAPDRPNGALLIALHKSFGNAEGFATRWQAARDLGVTVAVPQSPYPSTSDGGTDFTWPEPGVDQEVAATLDRVRASHRVDPERIVLAGFSQGGRLALEMAIRGNPFPVRGAITVAAGFREAPDLDEQASTARTRDVRFWFLTGDRDISKDAIVGLHGALQHLGLESRLAMVPGLAHAFPDDFDTRLPDALGFVLER